MPIMSEDQSLAVVARKNRKISRSRYEPRPRGSDNGPAGWASFTRLHTLQLIPRGACFSLRGGRQPGLAVRATKRDEDL